MTRPTNVRYYVLAALCLITFINYVQRNAFGPLETTIRERLGLAQADTGMAIAAFFLIYALMQIPTGKLAQHWGPRRALAAYSIGWSLAAAALGLSVGVVDLVAYRAVMGALQAGIFPCATLIMVAWLPPTRRAFASAMLNSFMLLGGAAVNNFTGFLLAPLGWRAVLFLYAVPGILVAVWFYAWFRNRPAEHGMVNAEELAIIGDPPPPERARATTRAALAAVLLSAPLWLLCAQQFCRAGASRFGDSWLSTYLQEVPLKDRVADDLRAPRDGETWFRTALLEAERVKQISDQRKAYANHLTSVPQYAGVIGGLFGGLLSDWLLRRTRRRRVARNGVAIASLGLAIACFAPMFAVASAESQIFYYSLGFFISSFASPCAYALSMDVGGKNLPVVFGAMNMVGNFGAAAMSQVVPEMNKLPGGWTASLILFVAVHAVALVCWLFLNPNRPIGESSDPPARPPESPT